MKFIKEIDHLEVLVSSINKMFFIARTKAVMRNKELYLLNLIANILNTQELTNDEQRKLASLYYGMLNKYSFLCRTELTRSYFFEQNKINQTFIPNECMVVPEVEQIFYWQEPFELTNSNIIDLVDDQGYLTSKPFDTYPNFELGKNITYSIVGKVVFLAMKSDNKNFIVTDVLNNDVTDEFDVTYIEDLNATLFVSKNNFAHGIMFFRFKKLATNMPVEVFNNIFNNIFA